MDTLVTISFDPTVDDRQDVLRAVGRAFDLAPEPERTWSPDGWWTPASMRTYVAALKPVARTVLSVLVRSAPCPRESVEHEAGLSAYRYAEAQASLQEALLVVPGAYRLPFELVHGCYTFDAELAELVARALGDLEDHAA